MINIYFTFFVIYLSRINANQCLSPKNLTTENVKVFRLIKAYIFKWKYAWNSPLDGLFYQINNFVLHKNRFYELLPLDRVKERRIWDSVRFSTTWLVRYLSFILVWIIMCFSLLKWFASCLMMIYSLDT